MDFDIEKFIEERHEALLSCDVDQVYAFYERWNMDQDIHRDVMEAGMHKARTACLTLPDEEREKSRKWLEDRDMHPLG